MVGSALSRKLRERGYANLLTPGSGLLDLTRQQAVEAYFKREKPEYVLLAAAKVGGIHANNTYPADFIHENLVIQNNVIHQSFIHGVKRLLFLGSSCIYPKMAPQPMDEKQLLTGLLEQTNEPYAIAKIAGIKLCESYNRQHGTQFIAVMPTNLYGPGDNFHPENSHVIPALIRRFHEAKMDGAAKVTVWGTGSPMREFLYVDDMAEGSLFVFTLEEDILKKDLLSYPEPCFLNLGTGVDVTIRELAETIKEVVDYPGALEFDSNRPDGTPRKLLDVSRLLSLGWKAETALRDGLEKTYRWYKKRTA